MDLTEIISEEREKILEIEGVVDVAQGEDEAGEHVIVFVEDEFYADKVKREIDLMSLLAGCRVVVQEELSIGPG